MPDKVIGQTRTGFSDVYARNLSANKDLDLGPGYIFMLATYDLVPIIIFAKKSKLHHA